MDENAIEDLISLFVLVKALVEIVAQIATALRCPKTQSEADFTCKRVGIAERVLGGITKKRHEIPRGGIT